MACRKGGYLRGQRGYGNVGRRNKASIRMLCQTSDGALNFGNPVNRKINRLNGKLRRNRSERTQIDGANRIVRIVDHANSGNARSDPPQSLHHFPDERELDHRKSGDVSAWSREAFRKARCGQIASYSYNRNRASQLRQNTKDPITNGKNYIWSQRHKVRSSNLYVIHIIGGPTRIELNRPALGPTQPCQFLPESTDACLPVHVAFRIGDQQCD